MSGQVSGGQAEFMSASGLPSRYGPDSSIFSFLFVGNMAIGSQAMDSAEICRTCSPRRLCDRSKNGTLIME